MKIKDTTIPPEFRLREQVEQLPDDEVFSTNELATMLNIHHGSLRRLTAKIPGHVVRLGSVNYHGSLKAIAAFKKHHKLS
jgi:hypothetical protein